MKVLVVRIHKGRVLVGGEEFSSTGKGIAVFVGLDKNDCDSTALSMVDRVVNLRIFEDESGKMEYSAKDKNYQILCIPNFTLCANTSKGRRPSFENSKSRQDAKDCYNRFVMVLKSKGVDTRNGEFGKHMDIDLELDGPVNIFLDSKE